MDGPGLYDDLCTTVRLHADADAAIVIVLGGKHGSGFSVQALVPHAQKTAERLPDILESIAAQMRVQQNKEALKAHERN